MAKEKVCGYERAHLAMIPFSTRRTGRCVKGIESSLCSVERPVSYFPSFHSCLLGTQVELIEGLSAMTMKLQNS